jgi:DNA-binding CsgD family transcriptional regulator
LTPCEYFGCAVAISDKFQVRIAFNFNFPAPLWESLVPRSGSICASTAAAWTRNRAPTSVELAVATAEGVQTRSILVHAIRDVGGNYSCFFFFAAPAERIGDRAERFIMAVTPQLYVAISNVIRNPHPTPCCESLSSREVEVLRAISMGKTNEEIALILAISKFTVKNHVQKILLKLNASNRTQAVIRALGQGILLPHPRAS